MRSASPQFEITLYVPDGTLRFLDRNQAFGQLFVTGIPELDFLPPPWWEDSHTVRLGLREKPAPV